MGFIIVCIPHDILLFFATIRKRFHHDPIMIVLSPYLNKPIHSSIRNVLNPTAGTLLLMSWRIQWGMAPYHHPSPSGPEKRVPKNHGKSSYLPMRFQWCQLSGYLTFHLAPLTPLAATGLTSLHLVLCHNYSIPLSHNQSYPLLIPKSHPSRNIHW